MPPKPDTRGGMTANGGVMKGPVDSSNWHEALLRAWQLSLLRFAVTCDNADRLGVLAVANEIDGLHRRLGCETGFSFFRRTSARLCKAIVRRGEQDTKVLQQYLESINNARLRETCAAALDIAQLETGSIRQRSRRTPELWKGLSPRGGLPIRSARN